MFDKPVVFVDIETTGIGWRSSRIIEIAAIRVEDDQITDELHSLVNPGMPMPAHITDITGITNTDLIGQPYFDELAGRFLEISRGAIFIAHNVRFDYSFIKNQLEEAGHNYRPELLCTVRLSRALFPAQRRHSLEAIIAAHDIKVADRHRAPDDAKALIEFCRIAHQKHSQRFHEAVRSQIKHRSTPPNLSDKLVANLPDGCGVYIFEDRDGQPLYVGKSISIRKRVRSHFTSDTKIDKEMKMSLGVHNIRAIETDNELEALLLESKLVKELLPLHNRQLRRVRSYAALIKGTDPAGYTTLAIRSLNLDECRDFGNIYGLFITKGKAKSALLEYQRTFSLCSKLLGLENTKGRCFHAYLGRCHGACAGAETPAAYNLRVELALRHTKLRAWPYQDSVIVSHKGSAGKGIVLDQWRIIGETDGDNVTLFAKAADRLAFDLDVYKILSGYLRQNKAKLQITPLKQAVPA